VEATERLAAASKGTPVFEGEPWNSNTVDLIRLARAHCLLVLHRTFADCVQRLADEVIPLAVCILPLA
jgi:acyl-CoA oxidase